MRTSLFFFLIVSLFHPSFAQAEDSKTLVGKDVFFEPGGGVRTRYFNLIDATSGAYASQDSSLQSRFQLDFSMNKGEFFQTFARLIHRNVWGRQNQGGDTTASQRDSFSGNNGLYVNEAWGLWRVNENLGLRFGRSPLKIGSGKTYGENQWFDLPTTFDHFDFLWDWESVKLGIIGAKLQELGAVSGATSSVDPEENHYIIDLDVSGMAEWILLWNFHFAQIERDRGTIDGGVVIQPSLSVQLFSVEFQFELDNFTGEVFGAIFNGSRNGGTRGNVGEHVYDVRLQYSVPEWSEMIFFAGAHKDSGDGNTAGSDPSDQHFDGFYYDVYGRSGRMEFLRWGNLLSWNVGLSLEATSALQIGLEFYQFQKVKAGDVSEFGQAGRLLDAQIQSGDITLAEDTELGSEFDLWLKYQLPSQVTLGLTYSAFLPGATFRNATPAAGVDLSTTFHQLITEVSLFF